MSTALDESIYLPYSVGLLQAYLQAHAPRPERYAFGIPLVHPLPPAQAVGAVVDADIVGFSTYVWNGNRSLAVARELKTARPETVIVFGGPHVPDDAEAFLRANPFIDVACHGEGERTFSEIAERYPDRGWEDVESVSFIDGAGRFVTTPRRPRLADLSFVPSPFLEGIFQPLMQSLPGTAWRTVWETNRGCPFSCTFCDWGSAIAAKVHRFELDRVYAEADWIGANGIDYVFLADANFGILPRDVEIAEAIVAAGKRHGYPKARARPADEERDGARVPDDEDACRRRYAAEMNISIQTTTPEVARGDQAPEHLARDVRRASTSVRARRDPDVRRHDRRASRRDGPVVQGERVACRRGRTTPSRAVPQPVGTPERGDGRSRLPGEYALKTVTSRGHQQPRAA